VTVGSAIVAQLAADPGVAALVGDRVYQLQLPQGVILPAVRVQLIDDPAGYHLRGPLGLSEARVQTDVYAAETSGGDPLEQAEAVAEAVDVALSGRKFDVGGARHVSGAFRISRQQRYEGDALREVRILQDFAVWSSPIV
jgi:hypothetical protein